ncbi:MAG: primosomal protein N', partial [Planctomycetes bacterium]|nr:primosomal protein N' [Planctomycetota bacterium]
SGKTEVYLRAIEPVVRRGQQAIVLVPEIALTPQTVRRFRARFERVAVLHSGLTESSRRNQWQRIARREADVVVGPRSAVFAPVSDLGLVVLDEEHEPSFKQNSTPRYHARDVAIMRAHFAGAAVVLGSATPSLESFANAKRGKFHMERLPSRVRERPLPPVEVVDMGQEFGNGNGTPLFSRTLVLHLGNALAAGEQAILFLNRRGHSSFLSCLRCGHVVGCPRCEVTLTWHAAFRRALCHYCGHEEPVGAACPACREGRLAYRGAGTERVESVVGKLFPDARLARMDSDTMGSRGAYEKVLGDFEARRIDILVGTQMIGKGLDFPGVTVVGVLSADTVLHFPDFRSAERTFQLVTQVAGRAGRGNRPGRVVVQTFSASHYAIECAARHDYASFCERDLAYRRELGYPPFGRLARVLCLGPDEAKVRERAREAALRLSGAHAKRSVAVLGPAPCPIARIDGKFRWHTLVKAPRPTDLAAALSALGDLSSSAGPVQVVVDVDPVEMV